MTIRESCIRRLEDTDEYVPKRVKCGPPLLKRIRSKRGRAVGCWLLKDLCTAEAAKPILKRLRAKRGMAYLKIFSIGYPSFTIVIHRTSTSPINGSLESYNGFAQFLKEPPYPLLNPDMAEFARLGYHSRCVRPCLFSVASCRNYPSSNPTVST